MDLPATRFFAERDTFVRCSACQQRMRASELPSHFCVSCIECRKTFPLWTEHLAMHDRRRARRKADKDATVGDGEIERRWYPRGNREFRERAGRIGVTPRDRLRWLVQTMAAKLNYAPSAEEMLKDIVTFLLLEYRTPSPYLFQRPGFSSPAQLEKLTRVLTRQLADAIEHQVVGKRWPFRLRMSVDLMREPGAEGLRHVWQPKYANKGPKGRADLGPAFLTSFFLSALDKLK